MKKQAFLLLGLLLVLTAGVGCGTSSTQPAPTRSPREKTHAAYTAIAVSVQQTISAQNTRGAYIPIAWPTVTPWASATPRPTSSLTLTLTLTYTPTPTTTASRTVSAPEMAAAGDVAPGTAMLTLQPGFFLELERAEMRARAGWYTPRHDEFLVLLGTFINQSSERHCVYSRQIRLGFEGDRYVPYVEAMSAARSSYDRDYPGPFGGQCIGADSRSSTFILFDVPERLLESEFTFRYRDARVAGLRLSPETDHTWRVTVED